MNWIKEYRELKGVTQEEMAKQLGFSRTLISKWETGSAPLTIDNAKIICDYFEIEYNDILNPRYVEDLIAKRRKGIKFDYLLMTIVALFLVGSIVYSIIEYAFGGEIDISDQVFLCIDPFLLMYFGWHYHKYWISLKDERLILIGYLKNKVPKKERDGLYKMNFNELREVLRKLNINSI